MPIYDFQCQSCQHTFERMLSVAEGGEPQACPECGSEDSKKLVVPVNFNLPGDNWASKNNRIAGQMRDKNRKLAAKEQEQKDAGLVPTLVPNVGGERCDSWTDAKKLAKEKGKDTSGYEAQERKASR